MHRLMGNKNHYIHGFSHTRIDNIFKSMKQRCYNINSCNYKNYGGKGIKICDEWLNNKSEFFNWAFENGYDETLTIDRIDVNGNYEPQNCRWVSQKEQQNNRSNNRLLTLNGETKTLAQWAEKFGLARSTLWARIDRYHMPLERALTAPLHKTRINE